MNGIICCRELSIHTHVAMEYGIFIAVRKKLLAQESYFVDHKWDLRELNRGEIRGNQYTHVLSIIGLCVSN